MLQGEMVPGGKKEIKKHEVKTQSLLFESDNENLL